MSFNASETTLIIAFVAGFTTFFAPCLLSLFPLQIGHLATLASSQQQQEKPPVFYRRPAFVNSLFYACGFLTVFIVLGITVNSLGRMLGPYRDLITKLGGILLIFAGLYILGTIQLKLLARTRTFSIHPRFQQWTKAYSLLLGVTFGISWTPCIGPVLAVILYWASHGETFWQGFFLLLFFGLGLAVPLILFSLFIDRLSPSVARAKVVGRIITIIVGSITLGTGILLLTGSVKYFIYYTLQFQQALFAL